MRVLHTADWHLGAKLGVHDRRPDHQAALDGLIEDARAAEPDLIIHAGDVWDGFHPSHDALHAGLRSLSALGALAPTIVIRGNHDSARLFHALEEVFRKEGVNGVRMVTRPQAIAVTTARAGTATVLCMPFLTLAGARQEGAARANVDDDNYRAWIKATNEDLATEGKNLKTGDGPTIYAAHLYVAGCRPGRSERRVTISDEYATDAGGIPEVDYAAFGHIHDPQRINRAETARYAGALIRMSFQEAEPRKTTVIAEIGAKASTVEEIQNRPGRPLVEMTSAVEELEARAADGGLNDCILRATVTSANRIYNLSERVYGASPRVRIHELINRVENAEKRAITDGEDESAPEGQIEDLFRQWRETRLGPERENDDAAGAVFAEAVRNGQAAGTSDFGTGRLEDEFDELRTRIATATEQGSRIARRTETGTPPGTAAETGTEQSPEE